MVLRNEEISVGFSVFLLGVSQPVFLV